MLFFVYLMLLFFSPIPHSVLQISLFMATQFTESVINIKTAVPGLPIIITRRRRNNILKTERFKEMYQDLIYTIDFDSKIGYNDQKTILASLRGFFDHHVRDSKFPETYNIPDYTEWCLQRERDVERALFSRKRPYDVSLITNSPSFLAYKCCILNSSDDKKQITTSCLKSKGCIVLLTDKEIDVKKKVMTPAMRKLVHPETVSRQIEILSQIDNKLSQTLFKHKRVIYISSEEAGPQCEAGRGRRGSRDGGIPAIVIQQIKEDIGRQLSMSV